MKIYLSRKPAKIGGGSNSFVWNFTRWAKKNSHKIVRKIESADKAIIIANIGEIEDIKRAKSKGVRIIHRIDEYFEQHESDYRREKHEKIKEINQYADITVFQSEFVLNNASPFLKPKNYKIILNGADPELFNPGPSGQEREYIGHITWSIGESKHLEILHERIRKSTSETFLLVGRHQESDFNFNMENVILSGAKARKKLPRLMRKMKMLYHPAENDPCSNTVIEAILCGVPVCYNIPGGTEEIVRDCGESLSHFDQMLLNLENYGEKCLKRTDLYFDKVADKYLAL